MSDKTITQLALEAGVETGGTENALAILKFAKAYADQELKKVNDFIRDIAKLLGEDGLGFDGLSWTVNDFKEAIDQEKRKEAIAFTNWTACPDCEYSMTDEDQWTRGPQENITTEQLYVIYLQSLPKTV